MSTGSQPIVLSAADPAFASLTQPFVQMCCEAAAYCFEANGHLSPARLRLLGADRPAERIEWRRPMSHAVATYKDHDFAVEHAAYAVAIALLHREYGFGSIARARKGKHYDFWIKKPGAGYHFGGERSMRVEVSGIFCGSGRVNGRLRAKLKQMARQSVPLAGLAMVAEFGSPLVA